MTGVQTCALPICQTQDTLVHGANEEANYPTYEWPRTDNDTFDLIDTDDDSSSGEEENGSSSSEEDAEERELIRDEVHAIFNR